MDYSEVKELIGIIDSSGLTEFQLTMDNVAVSMSKSGNTAVAQTTNTISHTVPLKNNTESEVNYNTSTPTVNAPLEKHELLNLGGEIVKAPIVGTYYAAGGAGKENFVKCGDRVKAGDTLCILEAMKIMNEIVSPCDGEVVEIYAKNEALVEYGQPLFRILS